MGKFKVGDKVRVKNVKVDTISCSHRFISEMNKYIGKEFTISNSWDDCYSLDGLCYGWAEDWLEPVRNKEKIMGKFKVDDKVRVKNVEVRTILHSHKFHPGMRKYIGKEFTIVEECDDGTYKLDGIPYFWEPDLLEPVTPETIVIYRNGDKTVALDKTTGRKAEAKCSKDDKYDFCVGAKIAFERLIGEDNAKEEPKLYNGKVVCIASQYKDLTKGKIYEFKDGFSKYDNGDRMPLVGDAITSFEDLEKSMFSKFIELVED